MRNLPPKSNLLYLHVAYQDLWNSNLATVAFTLLKSMDNFDGKLVNNLKAIISHPNFQRTYPKLCVYYF